MVSDLLGKIFLLSLLLTPANVLAQGDQSDNPLLILGLVVAFLFIIFLYKKYKNLRKDVMREVLSKEIQQKRIESPKPKQEGDQFQSTLERLKRKLKSER